MNAELSGPDRPLQGLRVLVTRPRHQASDLSHRLRSLGAEPVEAPTIRICDPPDRSPLLEAARRLATYDWVVLTSVNGVRKLGAALDEVGAPEGALGRVRTAAIGPATAGAVERLGRRPEVVPDTYRAEALLRELLAACDPPRGARILLARAAEARDLLPEGLRAAGARVDLVPAYVTRPDREGAAAIRRLVDERSLDWITFTSSSTVRRFVDAAGSRTGGARVAAIGPITAGTARELGLEPTAVARSYTIPGLVEALAAAEAGRASAGAGR